MNGMWKIWRGKKPVIGMVHLKALPGSPSGICSLREIYDAALYDAEALIEGGASAVEVENQFDVPYVLILYYRRKNGKFSAGADCIERQEMLYYRYKKK